MKTKRFALAILFPTLAAASGLTITVSGTGSGRLGSTQFTGAAFTFTLTTDTTLRVKPPCCLTTDTQPSTPTTFSIAGVASGTFTDNQIVFAYPTQSIVGFAHYNDGDLVDLKSPLFTSYDMSTSLGPITGVPSFVGLCPDDVDCATFTTSAGVLSFSSITTVTFNFVVSAARGSTPSAVSLDASTNPSTLGKAVTLNATVSPASATGKVTFYEGVSVLATSALSGGKAALTTVLLPSGVRSLKALYSGDAQYQSSSSAVVLEAIMALPQKGFLSPAAYGGVSFPRSIVVADFDGDGHPDLAAGDFDINRVSVLLNNGDGSFRAGASYQTPAGPTDIVAADFDGDGRVDLAVASGATPSNSVSVFLGNGDGTFKAPVNYSIGTPNTLVNPDKLVIGDFNGDGVPDIATANYSDNTVSVLLGRGDGTFQMPVKSTTGIGPIYLAVGDFNGDGRADLVLPVIGGINILFGKGDGTFQAPVMYSAGQNPNFVAVGDFNGDGQPDLAVANGGNDTVSVLLGNANGTFRAAVNYSAPKNLQSVAVGDFNGDGRMDLVTADSGSDNINILAGHGDGTFEPAVSYPGGPQPLFVAVGDFNLDGVSDLVVVNFRSTSVSILLGTAAAAPPAATLTLVSPPADTIHVGDSLAFELDVTSGGGAAITGLGFSVSTPTGGLAFDMPSDGNCSPLGNGFDCSGLADLGPNSTLTITLTATATAAGAASAGVVLRYNTPPQTVKIPAVTVNVQPAAGQPVFTPVTVSWRAGFAPNSAVVMPDMIVATDLPFPANRSPQGGVSTVAALDGRLTQLRAPTLVPVSILAGNFRGPAGANDVVILDSKLAAVLLLENLTGGPPPGFDRFAPWNDFAAAGLMPTSMAGFADPVTGLTDLAIIDTPPDPTSRGEIVVGASDGAGFFHNPVSYDAPPMAGNLIGANVNNDGAQDLLFLDPATNSVAALLNNAFNQFGGPVMTSIGDAPAIAMAAGNLNGDGFADLAVLTTSGLAVFLGNGDGTFSPGATLPVADPGPITGLQPSLILIADFNGDGNQDIAVASPASNLVTIYPGDGQGNFGAAAPYLTVNPIGLAAGVLRGATNPSLAVINGPAGTMPGSLSLLIGK